MYCSKMEPKAGLYLTKGGGAVEKVVEKDTVWEGAGGVLGDEARPLLEHEAHRADEQRRVAHGQPQLLAHLEAEELREAARAQVGELDVVGQPRGRHEALVEDEPVDQVGGAARGGDEVREPRRQLVDPRDQHRDAKGRVVLAAVRRWILLVVERVVKHLISLGMRIVLGVALPARTHTSGKGKCKT